MKIMNIFDKIFNESSKKYKPFSLGFLWKILPIKHARMVVRYTCGSWIFNVYSFVGSFVRGRFICGRFTRNFLSIGKIKWMDDVVRDGQMKRGDVLRWYDRRLIKNIKMRNWFNRSWEIRNRSYNLICVQPLSSWLRQCWNGVG